jgi:SpoVK/Ycf46/Vps4 family AAA+-type ATPase
MYGPPGCGKTHLARAVAGEVNARFLAVGIHDILDMYLGQSEQNLHSLFELARANTPCVLFFDEVDALGASRADMRQSVGRHVINQFLSEMDGIASNNSGVLTLAATNAPWYVDTALRRPGRFDRVIFVPPPDLSARTVILRIHLEGKPVQKINYEKVATITDGFSGADLRGLVDMAVENKLVEAMEKNKVLPIETQDLISATKRLKPTTKDWFATAKNYALYSNQSGFYDDILEYMNASNNSGWKLPFSR